MWLLNASFDGETGDRLETKLLKTGTSYALGRKERPLVINNKKISHDHCEFIVGKYTADDVASPGARPVLEFVNKKVKAMKLFRGGEELGINPQMNVELHDGDVVAVVSDVPVTIKWLPICCYCPPSKGIGVISVEACARLGINLVNFVNPNITHHLIPSFAASAVVAMSLLSACQFAKVEWLSEILRLGDLPKNDSSCLEHNFSLPPLTKYRPTFSPSLPPELKAFKVWEPNEERLNMLKGCRFLFVGEKDREIGHETKEMVIRGGAEYEVFNVNVGKSKWHQVLTKSIGRVQDSGKRLVVVGIEERIVAAVGNDEWQAMQEVLMSCGLSLIPPDRIIDAILHMNVSFIVSSGGSDIEMPSQPSSPLPSLVPNSIPDEPSVPPPNLATPVPEPTGPKLVRRAPSRQASQEPKSVNPSSEQTRELSKMADVLEDEAPRPRKTLTRRAMGGIPLIVGIDDPSLMINSAPDSAVNTPQSEPERPAPVVDLTIPTPARSTRLKRRAGTTQARNDSQMLPIIEVNEVESEPPLKKFKALFDASDPNRMNVAEFGANGDSLTQSQTLTQAMSSRSAPNIASQLSVLREEESESGASPSPSLDVRGTKRKDAPNEDGAGIPNDNVTGTATAKKRAIESINAIEHTDAISSEARITSKPPRQALKPGAAPGKPDTDAAFLKAIASTKRGKKTEDEFDREFNNLKISKPDLARGEPEKEWAILDDFEGDSNLRGNFMVVMEIDVFKKAGHERRNGQEDRPEWHSLPNFKKFKKKGSAATSHHIIELVVSDENDYGMGAAYWRGGTSQIQSQDQLCLQPFPPKSQARIKAEAPAQDSRKGKNRQIMSDQSDDEVKPPAVKAKGKSKQPSRAGSVAAPTSQKNGKTSQKKQPLFLDDDDEGIKLESDNDITIDALGENDPAEGDDTLTLRFSKTQKMSKRPPSKRAEKLKRAKTIVDDDSDDEAVFKGFKGTKKGR